MPPNVYTSNGIGGKSKPVIMNWNDKSIDMRRIREKKAHTITHTDKYVHSNWIFWMRHRPLASFLTSDGMLTSFDWLNYWQQITRMINSILYPLIPTLINNSRHWNVHANSNTHTQIHKPTNQYAKCNKSGISAHPGLKSYLNGAICSLARICYVYQAWVKSDKIC